MWQLGGTRLAVRRQECIVYDVLDRLAELVLYLLRHYLEIDDALLDQVRRIQPLLVPPLDLFGLLLMCDVPLAEVLLALEGRTFFVVGLLQLAYGLKIGGKLFDR